MLEIHHRHVFSRQHGQPENEGIHLPLTYEQREKARLKAFTDNGTEVRLFLERGKVLQLDETLLSNCGTSVKIVGRPEPLTLARCDDWQRFASACYHLGNRHVRLEIGDRSLLMKPDHVLEDMLLMLGLEVSHVEAIFNPESGAYHSSHHHHD